MDLIVWSVTNLIGSLILPPGVFLLLIAIGLWRGRKRWGRWLAGASLVLFATLSLTAVGYLLSKPFEHNWPPINLASAKQLPKDQTIIVVLGGGRVLGALEHPDYETLASASLRRSVYAGQLAQQTGLTLGLTGGKPPGGTHGEAVLMKNFIEKSLKLPVAVVEDQSFDTRQNANYMAKALGPKVRTVVLVTDVLHMPRAVRAFEAAGFTVVPAPMHFQASSPLKLTDFLPSVHGLEISTYAIRELAGGVWYRLRRMIPV